MNRKSIIWLIAAGLVLVVIASILGLVIWRQQPASTPTPTWPALSLTLTPPPSLDELIARYPQLAGILGDQELDSVYKDFLIAYQQGGIGAAAELARQRGILTAQNEVCATLILDTTDSALLVQQLQAAGVIVEGAYKTQVDIAIPLSVIEQAAQAEDPGVLFAQITALEHVVRVKLPTKTRTGSVPFFVDGQGPAVTGADAWHQAGLKGQNIRVGILDCGFGGYKSLLGRDLPDRVQAQTFVRGLGDADDSDEVHGTAVAEIVHEMAPNAELYLADYGCRGVALGPAVEWLLAQNVQIISHSAGSTTAPMDGSGLQSDLVRQAADRGVLWVNSAGNEAEVHYRGTWSDQDGDGWHEFASSRETMGFRSDEPAVEIVLRWDDWSRVDQDYDLVMLDDNGNEVASARDPQSGSLGEEPIEVLDYYGLEPGRAYYLAIYASSTTRAVTFDIIVHGDVVIEFPVAEYSLVTPADAAEALAVGAVFWRNDRITDYSSRGPTADERIKPDISAPSEVDNATYGRFGGTSAAAPHVAGAAALVWGAFPDWGRQQVWNYLIAGSKDLGKKGADIEYGAGRLLLPAPPTASTATAVAARPTDTPKPRSPTVTPSPHPTRVPTITPTLRPNETPHPTRPAQPTPTLLPTATRGLRSTPTPLPPDSDEFPLSILLGLVCVVGLLGGGLLLLGLILILFGLSRGSRPRPQPAPPYAPPQYIPPMQPRPQRAPPSACARCGRPLRPDARFCGVCGLPVPPAVPRCKQCGQELRPDALFCSRCGTRQ